MHITYTDETNLLPIRLVHSIMHGTGTHIYSYFALHAVTDL